MMKLLLPVLLAALIGCSTNCHAFSLSMTSSNTNAQTKKTAVIAGATGYIGKSVVRESVRQGYNTIALVRDAQAAASVDKFKGATLVECDVCDAAQLTEVRVVTS